MCHICIDLHVIVVQTYMSYLYRLTCHICIDLRGAIYVQTYVSYLYRLTCHICIDLHVIFVDLRVIFV